MSRLGWGEPVYLSGVVDGALSCRAGGRVNQSNKRYCGKRMPDRERLKLSLQGQFNANKVDSISDMYDILAAELSCYRSPRPAGTPSDVTS